MRYGPRVRAHAARAACAILRAVYSFSTLAAQVSTAAAETARMWWMMYGTGRVRLYRVASRPFFRLARRALDLRRRISGALMPPKDSTTVLTYFDDGNDDLVVLTEGVVVLKVISQTSESRLEIHTSKVDCSQ